MSSTPSGVTTTGKDQTDPIRLEEARAELARAEHVRESNDNPEPAARAAHAVAREREEQKADALFTPETCEELWRQWDDVQGRFVDEPRGAVEAADALVGETVKRLTDTFAHERGTLEQHWSRGGDASTEDLRQAFRRYRSFFQRLLEV